MWGLPQKKNARRAYKIRLYGHLRRYKKIVKKTYIISLEIHFVKKKTKKHDSGTVGRKARCFKQNYFKMGNWCFPNKKILRNSPCLPACKQKNIATRLRDTT